MKTRNLRNFARQAGLSLVEMLVAMTLGVTVMSSVVSVLVVSKSNFISERELATLQENARFAVSYMSEALLMAGYSGCSGDPLFVANSINGAAGNVFLNGTGVEGFDHEEASSAFPSQFRADVSANTDAIIIKRAENIGLSIGTNPSHNPNSATINLNKSHNIKPGQVMVVADSDCQQVGIFVVTGPTNTNNNATDVNHNEGGGVNCTKDLSGNFNCNNYTTNSVGSAYGSGSSVMRMRSEAFYVGASAAGNGIPALFREYLMLNSSSTAAEELVQGVENMQFQYGLDNAFNDGLADTYLDANDAAMNWDNVVSVRLYLRMRSINPVYNNAEAYGTFRGIAGTGGSDRFMRQVVSTTIQLRN